MDGKMTKQGAETKWCGAFIFWRTPSGRMLRQGIEANLLPSAKEGKSAIKSALYAQFPAGGEYSIRKVKDVSGQWEIFSLRTGSPARIATVGLSDPDNQGFPRLSGSLSSMINNEDAANFSDKIQKAVLSAKEAMLSVSHATISKRIVTLFCDVWKGVHTTGVGVYIPEVNRNDAMTDIRTIFKKLGWAENIFSLPVADIESARQAAAEVIAQSMAGELHTLFEDIATVKTKKDRIERKNTIRELLTRAEEVGSILQMDLQNLVCALQAEMDSTEMKKPDAPAAETTEPGATADIQNAEEEVGR